MICVSFGCFLLKTADIATFAHQQVACNTQPAPCLQPSKNSAFNLELQ